MDSNERPLQLWAASDPGILAPSGQPWRGGRERIRRR